MLSRYSVKKPFTVAVCVIAIAILGYISFSSMTTDLLPSMDLPYIVVITTYPGASPEEVELVVTKPLESRLATTNNIDKITSVSRENMSQVVLQFNDGSDMNTAMIEVSNALDLLRSNWPSSVGSPILMKLNPDMLPVMIAAVDVEGMDPFELSDYVSEKIAPSLEAINGVASVSANGLIEQEITVTISQELIDALNSKILAEIDSELADVERQLNDGERQLKQAKTELARQGKAGLQQIDDNLSKIQSGKGMMADQIASLKAQRAGLASQLAQAQEGEAQLSAALNQIPSELSSTEKALIEAAKQVITGLKSERSRVSGQLSDVEEQINQIGHSPSEGGSSSGDIDALKAERDRLKNQLDSIDALISAAENSDEYKQLLQLEAAVAQRPALEQQLEQTRAGIAQLSAGIAQLDDAIAKLEKGVVPAGVIEGIDTETNLNDAEQQLIDAREQAQQMMSMGADKIADAERQIGEARKKFEEGRDEAFKKAKMDGVITVQMVSQILAAQNFQMPAGYIKEGDQDFLVRVGDKFADLESMSELMLFKLGLDSVDEIRLRDVATVVMSDNSADSYSKINGNSGIMLSFQKQSTFSTSEIAGKLQEAFQKLMDENPGMHIVPLFDQGVYINMVVDSVLENLVYGAILAVLILLIFLGDYRPTLIIAFSIPISVVAAFVAMYFTGITLNVMSLAGLALGVGMLVDNSIVVIDNIYRLHEEGMPLAKACVRGAGQMSGAIFSSTLTTVCVFLPIVFIQGLARQLFSDMGLTIAFSLLASLVVALTLVPAMSASLLKRQKTRKHRIFGLIQRLYTAALRWSLRHKILVLGLALGLLIMSVANISTMGTSFMPSVDSTQMTASLKFPANATTAEQAEMSDKTMETLMGFADVDTIGVFQGSMMGGGGGGIMGGGGGGGSSVTFYILLKEDKSAKNETIAADMAKALEPLGYDISFRTSNMDISMLYGTGIQVVVKGPDLDVLRGIASEVAGLVGSVPGTVNVSDGQEQTVPEINLVVDKEKAAEENLTVAQIYQFVATTIADGTEVTKITLDNKDFPVIVINEKNQNLTREDIEELYIEVKLADESNEVRLGDVCAVKQADSLTSISRDAQQRVITVSCEIDPDHNIGTVGAQIQEKLDGYAVKDGYSIAVSGENEAINSTLEDLVLLIALAMVLIYLIMVAQFQSFLSPFIVIFTIPLAFTGGLLALVFAGMEISMVGMLGFLILAGVIVNNGIVFVDSVNQMRIDDGMSKREALVETGKVRLRPILMTALTTILGMSTIALGTGMGAEMMQPLAVVTIGGLTYGTFMTLFIVPVLYDMLNRKKTMKARFLVFGGVRRGWGGGYTNGAQSFGPPEGRRRPP